MIYVYTCILDGFDNLRPPLLEHILDGVRFICFTNLPLIDAVPPWEFRPAYLFSPDNSRNARLPKILPHLMLPPDAEYSIWHDGNFQLRIDPRDIVDQFLYRHDWAAHPHPARQCIYDEADILLRESIGTADLVKREIAAYRAGGYPERAGLWANGLIVRRHAPSVAELNERWWRLFLGGCERDQISFPFARWQQRTEVESIPGDVMASPYAAYSFHAPWTERGTNPDYWPRRRQIQSSMEHLAALTGSSAGVRFRQYCEPQ